MNSLQHQEGFPIDEKLAVVRDVVDGPSGRARYRALWSLRRPAALRPEWVPSPFNLPRAAVVQVLPGWPQLQ